MSKPSKRINDEVVPVLNSSGAMNVPYAIDVRREMDALHERIETLETQLFNYNKVNEELGVRFVKKFEGRYDK